MTGAHAGAGLGLFTGKAPGRPCIGDLTNATLGNVAHLIEGGDAAAIEFVVEGDGSRLRKIGFQGPAFGLPGVDAAVEHVDIAGPHDAQHPPGAGRREEAGTVINDDRVGHGNAEQAHLLGEFGRREQRMGKPGGLVGNRVLVEEDSTGNVA